MSKKLFLFVVACLLIQLTIAQTFTKADTLRGMLTPTRSCYDVTFYHLTLNINPATKYISGKNLIQYIVVNDFDSLQIDLNGKLRIDSIIWKGEKLIFHRIINTVFISFPKKILMGQSDFFTVFYQGKPIVAVNPPWDGGFVWGSSVAPSGDKKDWVGVACEGIGASCWWPCKDHLSDEPDSMLLTYETPENLTCIANGKLRSQKKLINGNHEWNWFISNPINNYDVTFNLADYGHIHDIFISGNDTLPLDYYVLKSEVEQAKDFFQQVKLMMACYEKYFGPYPFLRDGYKLVESTYWGMEHQSAIAYGNNYANNKWGFDFIIIHETAHEWWGNNVSCSDLADMWIHESFATYAEALFVECTQGYENAKKYLVSQRYHIENIKPIQGPYNVNYEASNNDQYYKGTWMLQTFRHVLNNDSIFFLLLKGIQKQFALKTIGYNDIVNYINTQTGKNYSYFFEQYLKQTSPPVFEYKIKKRHKKIIVSYRWKNVIAGFNMPLEITKAFQHDILGDKIEYTRITPTDQWQTITLPDLKEQDFKIDDDEYYVLVDNGKKQNKK